MPLCPTSLALFPSCVRLKKSNFSVFVFLFLAAVYPRFVCFKRTRMFGAVGTVCTALGVWLAFTRAAEAQVVDADVQACDRECRWQ